MRIFVSSTYEDLRDHRRQVDDIINRLCQQYIGMEYFGARPSEPREACLSEIASADVFIGIYAHRYGSIPAGSSTSITEQEFDHACRLGKPVYCFVVDPDFHWPPKSIEHAAAQQLEALKAKIGRFVRAQFTDPDNLAKQVAASLQMARGGHLSQPSGSALKLQFAEGVGREIKNSVNRKYNRELYVARRVGNHLRRRLVDSTTPKRLLSLVAAGLATTAVLDDEGRRAGLRRPRLQDEIADYGRLAARIRELNEGRLNPPADGLVVLLEDLRKRCRALQRELAAISGFAKQEVLLPKLVRNIDEFKRETRPVDLLIDRAGGGKTNLLCRLAEELGAVVPTLFVTARSIPGSDDDAIDNYFRAGYPIAGDPLRVAAEVAAEDGQVAIVIIDGINEHLEPLMFNKALQRFINKYDDCPIRFVVSCRDIYWTYFEDEWWRDHCRERIQHQVHAFRASEFQKALRLYLTHYDIDARPVGEAAEQLKHPLLLRFYCEAFRGEPNKPTRLGTVRDIRLLDLFSTYCKLKFEAIQEKHTAVSSEAVWEFVEMLGRMMLSEGKRVLRFQRVAEEAQVKLGENNVRQFGKRYVAIVDEDIILEERPIGVSFDLNVNFVYDEFMEYVIAHSLWRDLHSNGKRVRADAVIRASRALLRRENEFLSVVGVVVYLGGLLSRRQPAQGFEFIDWLAKEGRGGVAASIIERWPGDRSDKRLLELLSRVLIQTKAPDTRIRALETMGKMSQWNWPVFLTQVKRTDVRAAIQPSVIFALLGRLGGGPTAGNRLKTLRWMARLVRFPSSRSELNETGQSALLAAAQQICKSGHAWWKPSERAEAQRLVGLVNSTRQ